MMMKLKALHFLQLKHKMTCWLRCGSGQPSSEFAQAGAWLEAVRTLFQ